jgi:opacity protein-like surface antigen
MKKQLLIIFLIFLCFSTEAFSDDLYKLRLDLGVDRYISRVNEVITEELPDYSSVKTSQYVGIAIQKKVSLLSSIGSRIDIQKFNDHTLLSVRAIDYQLTLSESFKANIYLGAARYQFRTPAYGYTGGIGLLYHPSSWRNWGLQLEARYFDALARDKLTDEDPVKSITNDSFYTFQSLSFGVNYYF